MITEELMEFVIVYISIPLPFSHCCILQDMNDKVIATHVKINN